MTYQLVTRSIDSEYQISGSVILPRLIKTNLPSMSVCGMQVSVTRRRFRDLPKSLSYLGHDAMCSALSCVKLQPSQGKTSQRMR